MPKWAPYYPIQWIAWISSIIVLFAAAQEVMRLIYDSLALTARYQAFVQLQLAEYDAPYAACEYYYVPSTDLPSQPGGVGTGSMWRCVDIIWLLLIFLEEIPSPIFMGIFEVMLRAFGPEAGPWFAGYLMILIAVSMLSAPVGVVGNKVTANLRQAGAFALLANGAVTFFMGIIYKKKVRYLRGQTQKPDPAWNRHKKLQARTRFSEFRVALGKVRIDHVQVGPLRDAIDHMGAAMDFLCS